MNKDVTTWRQRLEAREEKLRKKEFMQKERNEKSGDSPEYTEMSELRSAMLTLVNAQTTTAEQLRELAKQMRTLTDDIDRLLRGDRPNGKK